MSEGITLIPIIDDCPIRQRADRVWNGQNPKEGDIFLTSDYRGRNGDLLLEQANQQKQVDENTCAGCDYNGSPCLSQCYTLKMPDWGT